MYKLKNLLYLVLILFLFTIPTTTVFADDLSADDQDRVPANYGQNYERLLSLKREYDPGNMFRINQNIVPA
jgi:hypothetical protein